VVRLWFQTCKAGGAHGDVGEEVHDWILCREGWWSAWSTGGGRRVIVAKEMDVLEVGLVLVCCTARWWWRASPDDRPRERRRC
jgi:hypothetical protein